MEKIHSRNFTGMNPEIANEDGYCTNPICTTKSHKHGTLFVGTGGFNSSQFGWAGQINTESRAYPVGIVNKQD